MSLENGLKRPAASPARRLARLFLLRGEEGTELVEFAVVFPALMAVLTLVASAAMGFYNYQQLASATGFAAQYVVDAAGLSTDPCKDAGAAIAGGSTSLGTTLPAAWQVKNWTAASYSYRIAITSGVGTSSASTYYSPSSTGLTAGAPSSWSCTGGVSYLSGSPPVAVVLTVSYSYNWFPVFHSHNFTGQMSPTTGALTVSEGAIGE